MNPTSHLRAVLRDIGIRRGGILLVHASLSGTGLRAADLLHTVRDVLGPEGTVVVPTFTPENSDTSRAHRQRTQGMTEGERVGYLASMPPYDPRTTPSPTMGVFAELVRTRPDAVRSSHPQTSFAALGPRAAGLLAQHATDCHLGERSPLGTLYREDAQVLLFRVGFDVCSAFHLAEYRVPGAPRRTYRCVLRERGGWFEYEDTALDDGDFAAIGAELPRESLTKREIRHKQAVLLSLPAAVDAALIHRTEHRHRMA